MASPLLKAFGPVLLTTAMTSFFVAGCTTGSNKNSNKTPTENVDSKTLEYQECLKKQQAQVSRDSINFLDCCRDSVLIKAQLMKAIEMKNNRQKEFYNNTTVEDFLRNYTTDELKALAIQLTLESVEINRAESRMNEKDLRKFLADLIISGQTIELQRNDSEFRNLCKVTDSLNNLHKIATGETYNNSKTKAKQMQELLDKDMQALYDKAKQLVDMSSKIKLDIEMKEVAIEKISDPKKKQVLSQELDSLKEEDLRLDKACEEMNKRIIKTREIKGYNGLWVIRSNHTDAEMHYFMHQN